MPLNANPPHENFLRTPLASDGIETVTFETEAW